MSIYNRASVMSIRTARIVSQGWQSHCFSDEARVVATMVMSLHTLGGNCFGAVVPDRVAAAKLTGQPTTTSSAAV